MLWSILAFKSVLIEKNMTVRFLANTRLISLHHSHHTLLPLLAIGKPFHLQQDVTLLNASSFKGLDPVIVVFATPPCQAFSAARPTPGWQSIESIPFISYVNLIKSLSDAQGQAPITYFIENVPNTAKFSNIIDSLGTPLILEAHQLGSTALKKTTIWTNSASPNDLRNHYERSKNIGDTPSVFLHKTSSMTSISHPKLATIYQNSWHAQTVGDTVSQHMANLDEDFSCTTTRTKNPAHR